MKITKTNKYGFTLVELLIAMFISALAMGTIFVAYKSQNKTYAAQLEVAQMQQNMRASLNSLVYDLRQAGLDPTKQAKAGLVGMGGSKFKFAEDEVESNATSIAFTSDLNGDGEIAVDAVKTKYSSDDVSGMEQIAYKLNNGRLQKYTTESGAIHWQDVAEDIQEIEFRYLNSTGGLATKPEDVRSIQISILGRSEHRDRNGAMKNTFTTAGGATWGPYNDDFRRRLLITKVQCRNLR